MINYERKPLDPTLYFMEPMITQLYKTSTGIRDDEELKRHIIHVQEYAYRIFPYPYIRLFSFTRLAMPELPIYREVLRIGAKQPGAILLEIGAGFGNDVRTVVADGYPAQDVVAMDLRPEMWDIGHRLFRSNPATFPVKFLCGDIFDERVLSSNAPGPAYTPRPRDITTLTSLKGHTSVIYLQSVFHLFDDSAQYALARRLAQLLSPTRGSIITGRQMGYKTPKYVRDGMVHSPQSWEAMWATVFPKGTVEYRTELVELGGNLKQAMFEMCNVTQFLTWSIRRL